MITINEEFDSIYEKDIPDIHLSVEDSTPSDTHVDWVSPLTDIVSRTFLSDYANRFHGELKQEFLEMVENYIQAGIIGTHLSKNFHEHFYQVEIDMDMADSLFDSTRIYFISNSHLHIELIAELEFWWKPLDFEAIFKSDFAHLLSLRGINDIRVKQSVTGDDVVGFDYDVLISSDDTAYRMKSHGDRDLLEPFVLIINKLLLHKPVKERFVRSIDSGDIAYLFMAPETAIQCLSQYNFRVSPLK